MGKSDRRPKVVVLGNGMVGYKFCEQMVELDGNRTHRLTVFGEEPRPAYEMASVLASQLTGGDTRFTGADMSTKLKLMGIDVANFGDAFGETTNCRTVVYKNDLNAVYKRLTLSEDGTRPLGRMPSSGDRDSEDHAGGRRNRGQSCPVRTLRLYATGTVSGRQDQSHNKF